MNLKHQISIICMKLRYRSGNFYEFTTYSFLRYSFHFSQAVQEEVNLRYKEAFDLYKDGIDKLLSGAKNDFNERRKSISKKRNSFMKIIF